MFLITRSGEKFHKINSDSLEFVNLNHEFVIFDIDKTVIFDKKIFVDLVKTFQDLVKSVL